jgi:hypothetical protein
MTAAFAQEYEELHRLVDRLPVERMLPSGSWHFTLSKAWPRIKPRSIVRAAGNGGCHSLASWTPSPTSLPGLG